MVGAEFTLCQRQRAFCNFGCLRVLALLVKLSNLSVKGIKIVSLSPARLWIEHPRYEAQNQQTSDRPPRWRWSIPREIPKHSATSVPSFTYRAPAARRVVETKLAKQPANMPWRCTEFFCDGRWSPVLLS